MPSPLPFGDFSVSRPSHNLPIQLTSFVGRDQQIAEIKQVLPHTRLLTLTGSGGCGKTRLALQVAGSLVDSYVDGAWLVELASLSDSTLVPEAVASALGIPEQPGLPLRETLRRYFQTKSLLLVLDNCEHLLRASAELIGGLLHTCPHLRILTTSRVALGVPGETLWRVPSLSLPDPGRLPSPGHVQQYEAVRLFVERARAVQPMFNLTVVNAPAVVKVCHRLDGVPLAIELAAARARVLAVEQIAAKLDDRFRLLTGGDSSTLPRHQTLKATMDWSYGLLADKEKILLRRLSVFAGGWTLGAAEAICAGDGVAVADILDLLTHLVDNSLVMTETQGAEARYRLLETVRQYGQDRLVEAGDADVLRQRHRDFFLELAERAEPELRGAAQDAWLDRLETEHDNLWAALEWSRIEEGGAEAGLRLAGALHVFWHLRGYWSEGRGWLEGALARSHEAPVAYLPKALHGAALLMRRLGDYDRATPLCEKGLALSRELGDKRYAASFLIHFGIVAMNQTHYAQATRLHQEALTLGRESQDKYRIWQGLSHLAEVALREGNYGQAATYYSESLAVARELGDKYLIAITLRYWGEVDLRRGDYEQAAARYTEGLATSCQVGARRETEECIDGLGQLACAKENYEQAGRLFGVSEALRAALRLCREPAEQAHHDRSIVSTQAALGEAAFAAVWAEGQTMTLGEATEYALTGRATPEAKGREPSKPAIQKRVGPLAPREREVAALIAEGRTNREIAARLSITESTAETHVQHILNKLGFNSRAQIAAWAVAHGLHTVSSTEH